MTVVQTEIAEAPAWLLELAREKPRPLSLVPLPVSPRVKTVGEIMAEAGKLEGFTETAPGKLRGCCIFHDDTHPSAAIWIGDEDDLGSYHCSAGCGSFGAKDLAARLGIAFHREGPLGPGRTTGQRTYRLDEVGNAERLVDRFGDVLRYCPQRRSWLVWDGSRWAWDEAGTVFEYARKTINALFDEARDSGDDAKKIVTHAVRSRTHRALRDMIAQAATMPAVIVHACELDADPWLFNVANGTLDLRSGTLRAHDPADLITRQSPVVHDPEACAKRWERCLEEIFARDTDAIAFLQRWGGYALTGVIRDHVVLIAHGTGRNGKGTVFERLRDVLGDYAVAVPFAAFTESRYRDDAGARPDIVRMRGARMITTAEGAFGTYLDESTIKRLSGGDTIYARGMRENGDEFQVVGKCILQTNHRPLVKGTDTALKARLRLLPFNVSFAGREDTTLAEALKAELPGILNWLLAGCRAYQVAGGVGSCTAVDATTSDYFTDMDVIQGFLDEWVIAGDEVPFSELYDAYKYHCQEAGIRPLSGQRMGERLTEKGVGKKKRGGRAYRTGIVLARHVPVTGGRS